MNVEHGRTAVPAANGENAEAERKSPLQKVGECLYRHSSSRVYYALVKKAGKQYRQSLKTTDRKVADRKLSDFKNQVFGLAKHPGSGKLSFSDVAKSWLTTVEPTLKPASARRLKGVVMTLGKYFGTLPVRSITTRECEEFVAKRGADISASTFNKDREALRAILNYAKREGLLLTNPAEVIKRRKQPKAKIVIPSKAEFSKLVATLRRKDSRYHGAADLVELLAYSGMRLAEGTQLTWTDINFERDSFVVTGGEYGTKNHDARSVPLFPALKVFLTRLKAGTTVEPADKVVRVGKSHKAIETACKEAKVPRLTHHSLRHYFVSNAIEAGVDFKTIAAWIGHKDGGILVAQTYGHLRDTHSTEMAKRMTFAA